MELLKNAPEYIDPSGHFVLYDFFVTKTSFSFVYPKVKKLNISAIYKELILFFYSESIVLSTIFLIEKLKSNQQENLENIIKVKFEEECRNRNLI